jgi:hypothetical protein
VGTVEIGIALFPEHCGHGIGTEAQRQLVDYLFDTSRCIACRPGPKSTTSPSSVHWNGLDSGARASFGSSTFSGRLERQRDLRSTLR